MNITAINVVPFLGTKNVRSTQIINRYGLGCDCVSFSGKKKTQPEYSNTAKQGIKLGKEILDLEKCRSLSYRTLVECLNEKSPVPVDVKNINDLPNMVKSNHGRILAHMLPGYDYDFQLAIANIYLGNFPATSKEATEFAADTAHEYTHVLQRANDKNYYGILKYTTDPNEVTIIARASQGIMNQMCAICQEKLFTDRNSARKLLDSISNGTFDVNKTLGNIDFEELIESSAQMVADGLNKDKDDIRKAITGWIIQETQNEIEAYTVSLDILNRSKCDNDTKSSRTLSKEINSYLNEYLKKQI